MQTLYKRSSVIGCFALLLAIVIGAAFITKRQLDIQVRTAVSVIHTRQVLLQLSQTESLLKDAETGQRGYLYTGKKEYLAPYHLAVSNVDSHIDALAKLTADNPEQRARIVSLRNQTRAKLAELAETIKVYDSGNKDQAKELVIADSGSAPWASETATVETIATPIAPPIWNDELFRPDASPASASVTPASEPIEPAT